LLIKYASDYLCIYLFLYLFILKIIAYLIFFYYIPIYRILKNGCKPNN
jgi:hypothetical protein